MEKMRKMKRVLCIVSSLNTGGAETFLMKLYRTFDRNSYQMDFVVNEAGIYDEEVKNLGGKIYTTPLRTKHPINSFFALKRIVKENKYEYVLKLCDTPIGVIDVLAAKLGGARRVGVRSCNASANIGKPRKAFCFVLRPLLNSISDYKVAPSELAARFTFGDREVDEGNVQLLHNGIDIKKYQFDKKQRECIRKQYSVDEDTFLVGHIGRFSKQKNHAFLIEVFKEIVRKRTDSVLLLVGSGELEYQIKNIAKQYGLLDKVIFTGVRSDIPALLSAMDVFVFPSFYEGMPNTVIEAQANGLPCVISDAITREAGITKSVTFIALKEDADKWADKALAQKRASVEESRKVMITAGYSINDVVNRFCEIIFESKV